MTIFVVVLAALLGIDTRTMHATSVRISQLSGSIIRNLAFIVCGLTIGGAGTAYAGGTIPPASFQHAVTFGGETITIDFSQHSARGPNFSVQEELPAVGFSAVAPGPIRTYLGSVQGVPGAIASGLCRANGDVLCRVSFEDGKEWVDLGGGTVVERNAAWTPSWPDYVPSPGGAGSNIYFAEIGVDLPNSQVVACGGTALTALEMTEYSVNTTNLIYLRDAGCMNQIERVIVRMDPAADPYAALTSHNGGLGEVANQWNNVLPAGSHDVALVAARQLGGGSGVAYVGAIGNPGYSSNGADDNGDFATVWRHEVGHNWSLSHFDGNSPEGRTINSGNTLSRMSGPESEKARSHRDARVANLVNIGSYGPQIPPRASIDRLEVEPSSGTILIDGLVNDHDANGDPFTILSFDPLSSAGNMVSRSVGTGPGGRDQLAYVTPSDFSSASEYFFYRIEDSSGMQGVAPVVIRTRMAGDLLGHWTFNDALDPSALDSSAKIRHGALGNGASKAGGRLVLDGIDPAVSAEALGIESNTITYTGWINRSGDQSRFTGIFFTRDGANSNGLNFGNNNELGYHWENSDWWFDSGLTVPDGVWTFVGLVIEPTQATFYMDSGTGLQQVVRPRTNPPTTFKNSFNIGQDPHSSGRRFSGMIDDVRVHARALSSTEIAELASGGGEACDPVPRISEVISDNSARLCWTSNLIATGHRVYFSQSYTAVRDGIPGSASDQGIVLSSFFDTGTLTTGTYYWRVDSINPSGEIRGNLWSFQKGESGLVAHWKLDENSGATALEESGLHDGVWNGNPTFSQDGASLGTATSVCLDGSGDFVEVPYDAALNPATFTVSLWARVDGGSGYRSPLTSRDVGPASGYILYADPSNQWQLWLGNGGGWSTLTGTPVVNGEWVHLTGSYDGSIARFYIDGALVSSRSSALSQNTARPLRIGAGRTDGSASFDFNGCVDDVRIWKRALSGAEIAALSEYAQWSKVAFAGLGSGTDLGDDPDLDELVNLFEYAFDTNPQQGGGIQGGQFGKPHTVQVGNQWRGRMELPKVVRQDLTYRLQRANSPSGPWTIGAVKVPGSTWEVLLPGIVFTDGDSADTQRLEWSLPEPGINNRFWRLGVTMGN